jgi:cell division protein ZapA (FtsZ GTPase activity inhibitor)
MLAAEAATTSAEQNMTDLVDIVSSNEEQDTDVMVIMNSIMTSTEEAAEQQRLYEEADFLLKKAEPVLSLAAIEARLMQLELEQMDVMTQVAAADMTYEAELAGYN